MIFSSYIHPFKYFLRTFISSPIQANIDLFYDLKKDFRSKNLLSKRNIIWINGVPKSGTTLVSSILDFNCIKSMPVSCKIFNLASEFDAKIIGKFDFNIDLVLLIY